MSVKQLLEKSNTSNFFLLSDAMTLGLPQPSCNVTENKKCWQRDDNVETKANNSYHN